MDQLPGEISAMLVDWAAWLAICQGLLFAAITCTFGTFVARRLGLLDTDARTGETIAVGVATGAVVLAAWLAAVGSGGRSSLTPVALVFAVAIIAVTLHGRQGPASGMTAETPTGQRAPTGQRSSAALAVLLATGFIVAVAVIYGAALAPSPRDGAQPIPFKDPAFYAILGRDLAATGIETTLSPSGFVNLPGQPTQVWYHWGELWLAAADIRLFGTSPLDARYFVVLPVLLLATAGLAGAIVQRLTRASPGTYLLGFVACLFLAPAPWVASPLIGDLPFVATLTVAMFYGINTYGLAATAALLATYAALRIGARPRTWAFALFLGSTIAALLPLHLAIALLSYVGAGAIWASRTVTASVRARRVLGLPGAWRRTLIATSLLLGTTIVWGTFTDHGLPTGAISPGVPPFNWVWVATVSATIIGAGAILAIPIAWLRDRRTPGHRADLQLAAMAILVAGAIGWGLRDGDFDQYYLFFAAITVYVAPAAAVGLWSVWVELRASRHRIATVAVMLLCIGQMELGATIALHRVVQFGAGTGEVPLELLDAVRDLPAGASVAYACKPFEETTYSTPNLLGLAAYSGHAMIPMCFEVDRFGVMAGAEPSSDRPNTDSWAPQRVLYPNAAAHPSSQETAAFLIAHGIRYIYADGTFPNTLVDEVIPIKASGSYQLLRVP